MQVNELRKCGEDLKTKLGVYQTECIEKVENYCSELKTKRDELESLWKTTSTMISKTPDAEMISGFRASVEKVSAKSVRYLRAPSLTWKLFNKPAQNIGMPTFLRTFIYLFIFSLSDAMDFIEGKLKRNPESEYSLPS